MDRYMGGEDIAFDLLVDDLETAVARGTFFPVIPVCALSGLGLEELLEIITRGFPPPSEHTFPVRLHHRRQGGRPACRATPPAPCSPRSSRRRPTRTSAGSAWSGSSPGTIRPDATVHVSGHSTEFYGERARPRGPRRGRAHRRPVVAARARPSAPSSSSIAGDICAIAKLTRAETGDTLSDKDNPLVMEPWSMPDPLLPIAVVAHAKADEDKLGTSLQRLAAEDPSVRIEHHPETLQLVLWCMGEAHADVLLDRLTNRYGVQVDQVDVRVPLRETLDGPGQGTRPARQAERRARPVRRLRPRGRAAGDRARASSSSTRSSAARCRGSSSPASRRASAPSWPEGPVGRLPGRRRAGDAVRRQGAQRRLERHGLPDRRRARAAGGCRRRRRRSCSSRSTRSTS